MKAYYTKSLKDDSPKGHIHFYDEGERTLCGKLFTTSGRWFIDNRQETPRITCPKCLEKYRRNLNQHGRRVWSGINAKP